MESVGKPRPGSIPETRSILSWAVPDPHLALSIG